VFPRQIPQMGRGADRGSEAAGTRLVVGDGIGAEGNDHRFSLAEKNGQNLHFLRSKAFEAIHIDLGSVKKAAFGQDAGEGAEIVERIDLFRLRDESFIRPVNQSEFLRFLFERSLFQRGGCFRQQKGRDRALFAFRDKGDDRFHIIRIGDLPPVQGQLIGNAVHRLTHQ